MPEPQEDKTRVLVRPGATFAHYQILSRIGTGGMGEVHLAHDTKLDRRVALKLLPEGMADRPELRVRFLREARAAARLDHPNIITIHEVGEFEGRPYIAMQYVEGRPLSHYCGDGSNRDDESNRGANDSGDEALSLAEILHILCGVCEGLGKAHAVGITHRDIKPANILLREDLRPVILDFGLANLQGDEKLTRIGSAVGTVAYMSPEQAQGREVDSRSDIFSCGIVLYELIARRSPFRRDNEAATLYAIATSTPEPLARYKNDVPGELQRMVSKCLAKSPADRYQAAADLLADLRTIERSLASGSLAGSPSPFTRTSTQPSVAVLPFANMSADPENEYFSDGLTEELLNILAKNPGLKVTGRTSSFAFKGKHEDVREIGQKLGVATLLEGSVRKAGNRVRITVQLVNTNDGFHLWSETYDRVLEDVFALQDEIARAVSEALNVTLLKKSKTRTIDPDSYVFQLRANHHAQQMSKSSMAAAIDLYRKAIQLDPQSGRAWAGLAGCLVLQEGFGMVDHAQGRVEAREALSRAFELDDELPEAYEVSCWFLSAFEPRLEESIAAIQRAHALAPSDPRILMRYAITEGFACHHHDALRLGRQAVELDPLDPSIHMNLGRVFLWAGQYREAETQLRRALELSPGLASATLTLSWALLLQGRAEEALDALSRDEPPGYRLCGETIIFHSLGRTEESDRALAELVVEGDRWAFQVAQSYAWRGEIDQAFVWLEKSRLVHDTGTIQTKVHPLLKNLHEDPRWSQLLERIGYPE
jgi:serine/threonine protein kinase/Flp pilus assembly protein TadD